MSQTVSAKRVAAAPIRALIIQPDNSYEVREIKQDSTGAGKMADGNRSGAGFDER
jgi:hypothetical protein